MGLLEGRVSVVTGGGSGIGLATAERFATEGARVVVVDMNADAAEAAAAKVDGMAVTADVGDGRAWDRIVGAAEDTYGGVDIAYLNAGVTTGEADITALTDGQYRRVMGANVDGVVFGVRAMTPALERRGGGAIVVTASLAGLIAFPPDPIYTLTKHAVVGLVRSLSVPLRAKRVTINAVCPGIVDTPLVGEQGKQMLQAAGFPMIDPADIAAAVLGCVTGGLSGECFVCQAGLDPTPYEFHDVPGPRAEGGKGRRPPISEFAEPRQ